MFLLMAIREHVSDAAAPVDRPRLVVVLEEAHNLVPAVPDENAGGEETSAKVEASRYISNMLAEMRALGLAILVVDQTPAAVAPQVIRNTNLKVAHRTVSKQDRETLADAMLMQEAHAELLGRLVPGQAYVYADRFFRPHLMQGAFAVADKPIVAGAPCASNVPPTDRELSQWMLKRGWFKEAIRNRIQEIRERSNETAQALEAFLDVLKVDVRFLRSVPDFSQRVSLREKLQSSWHGKLREISQRLRSLEAEQRAVAASAPSLRLRLFPKESHEGLLKMEAVIKDAVLQIENADLNEEDNINES